MSKAIYPGSFDPVTNGHLDIIERASGMFDEVVVGVLKNSAKKAMFTAEERVNMIRELTVNLPNVEVKYFDGLLVDFACKENARTIVRGLRAVTDFDYELQLAQTNRVVNKNIDTVFLATNLKYSYLSSSIVKEIASYDGDISQFVDPMVAIKVKEKFDNLGGK